jgi:hypothetical protein
LLSDILLPQGRIIPRSDPRPPWPRVLARASLFAGLGLLLAGGFMRTRYEVFVEPEFNLRTLKRADNSMVATDPNRPDIARADWPEHLEKDWGRETAWERQARIATAIRLCGRYMWLHAVPDSLCIDSSISSIPLVTFGDREYLANEKHKRIVRAFRAGVFDSGSIDEVRAHEHLLYDPGLHNDLLAAARSPQMMDSAAVQKLRARDDADLANDPEINLGFGFALALLGGFVISAVVVWRRNPMWTLGVGLYTFSFALVSNIFMPIGLTFADRTQYMDGTGAMILMVLLARAVTRPLRPFVRERNAWVVLALAVCVAYSVRTVKRNMDWLDGDPLFTSAWQEQPMCVTNINNYAAVLARQGGDANYDKALEILRLSRGLCSFNGPTEQRIAVTLYDRFQNSSTSAWDDWHVWHDKQAKGEAVGKKPPRPCGKEPTKAERARRVDVNRAARIKMLDEAIAATHNAIFHLQLAKDEVFLELDALFGPRPHLPEPRRVAPRPKRAEPVKSASEDGPRRAVSWPFGYPLFWPFSPRLPFWAAGGR